MQPIADHVARAGFAAGTPVVVARIAHNFGIEAWAAGHWPDGRAVTVDDRFYAASLAKQVTGCATALLVRDGILDPDRPIETWLPEVTDWVHGATPRQLAHHIAGLPPAGELEARVAGDWTAAAALAALTEAESWWLPGERHVYSNIGYVLLAQVVAAASGIAFADFVEARLVRPLKLSGIGFEQGPSSFPQSALMGPSLPSTHGDGGLWSTAPAFAAWLQAQNADAFGVARIVESVARLNDGTVTDYGWGIGLREHRGYPLFIHGGEWPGAAAKAARSRDFGVGIVAMAAGAPIDTVNRLVASLLNEG